MGMAQYCYGCGLALSVELYIALGGGQYNCGGSWCCGKRLQLWVWLNTVLGVTRYYYIILYCCGWSLKPPWVGLGSILL